MIITLAQMRIIPGRPDLNFAAMTEIINARRGCSDIIIFPEMAIPGYLIGDLWEQDAYLRECENYNDEIVRLSIDMCIVFGSVAVDWDKIGDDGRVRKYNAAFVAQNGRLCGGDDFIYPFRIKSLLPNYREFEETRHFYCTRKLAIELCCSPDKLIKPVKINYNNREYNIGLIICEDGWDENYALKPVDLLCAHNGIDCIVNLSCSPYTYGKNNKRHRIFASHAAKHRVPLIYLNAIGIQNNGKTIYTFDGSSCVYDANGAIKHAMSGFTHEIHDFDARLLSGLDASPQPADDISTIYQALRYGISEFTQSIGIQRVVIGASGGIDSAVAAALYVDILGPEHVLLVNMPTAFNSSTTKSLAHDLAVKLNCNYTSIAVQQSADYTVEQLKSCVVEQFNGSKTTIDLAPSSFVYENIQARDRSSRILAAIAASWNAGFTCNANKAETTVGYSTLYGDHAGFLAALADLWKHQVYALAHHINDNVFEREVIPQGTIDIVPSAELSNAQNVDEGKGDPLIYPYHDYLFKSFIEGWNRATPEDILAWYMDGTLESNLGCEQGIVVSTFPTPLSFIEDLERWWQQFSGMGLAKRIQAPPIIAISRRAYGFDLREAQCGVFYTRQYLQLKNKLLAAK